MMEHGLDPNFHEPKGGGLYARVYADSMRVVVSETPLTVASTMVGAGDLIKALVAGGAHLDYRNMDGQTPLHKAVFCATSDNVKTLLELGET
jgi:ankyrin repeat protein